MKLKSVSIYKPQTVSGFEVGAKLIENDATTNITVKKITVNFFRTVKVFLSDKRVFVFKGFPISFSE